MSGRLDPKMLDDFRKSLILGTHRASGAAPPAALSELLPAGLEPEQQLLGALALLGQHARLTRSFPVAPLPPARALNGEAMVPEAARSAVRHLLGTPEAIRPTLERLAQSALRLHPFDLAELAKHLEPHAAQLHPSDRQALQLEATEASEDWRILGPKVMARHFVQWRQADPTSARNALEPVFGELEATARREVIAAFAHGLSEADRPFLEAIASDRSKTVRDHVESMLGTFSGTVAHDKRLQQLAEDLTVAKRTLRGLSIGVARGIQTDVVVERARGLRLADLLSLLQIDRKTLLKPRPHITAQLEVVFLEGAMRDDDAEAVKILARDASVDWGRFAEAASPGLSRATLAEHLPALPVRTTASQRIPMSTVVESLTERLGRPWPAPVATALLRGLNRDRLVFPMTMVLPHKVLADWIGRLPEGHLSRHDPWLAFLDCLAGDSKPAPKSPGDQ